MREAPSRSGSDRDRRGARLVNAAGVAIGAAGLAFVVHRIVRDRHEIADALGDADPVWLLPALATGAASMALIGWNWLWILHTSGAAAPPRRAMSWFYVGQLGKYVPGGIWPVVGQAELAHRGAVPRGVAYSSTALSLVGTFLGAAVVGAVGGLLAPPDGRWIPAAVAVAIGVGAIAYAAPGVRARVDSLSTRIARRDLALPPPRRTATVVARHLPVWILFSGMNGFSAAALDADLDTRTVVAVVAVTCLSWMAGFVVVGVPGGLGVREAVFISMMTAQLGATTAVSVAVLSRVVSVAVDLGGAAVAVPVARHAPPPRGEPSDPNHYASP